MISLDLMKSSEVRIAGDMSKKLWTKVGNFWTSPRLNKNNHFPMPPVYILLNIFWKLYLQAER